ncbi:MAG: tetratricopeptide repeat protein [Candidatus Eisenbacteria bacterium]
MHDPAVIRAQFAELIGRDDEQIELARAALLVAAEDDAALDVGACLATLDAWGTALAAGLAADATSVQRLARLRAFMFEELGFRGDVRDYYSPENSLLNAVMQRRLGIPLTLGIVFMELGWRIGLRFEGVAFPGHFLVRLAGEESDLLLDPFDHGTSVHEDDCRRMIAASSQGTLAYEPGMIRSVTRRDMVARLLLNLKVARLRAGDSPGALAAVEKLLVLFPDSAPELRDRGLLQYQLDRYRPALEALEEYLRLRPDAVDRAEVERVALTLRMMLAAH